MMQAVSPNNDARRLLKFSQPHNPLVRRLQKQVANAFNLYLNYKHYHWQTFGPLFRDLNIIFDEFATDVYSTVEVLAERIRTIGQNRVRVREFAHNASIKPAKKGSDIRQMLEEANSNVLIVIRELREAIKNSEHIDPASANILKRFLQVHEKHQWWLHYILEKRQGLTT